MEILKKLHLISILIAILLNIQGCYLISNDPEITVSDETTGKTVAVVNFSVHGQLLPAMIGVNTADKLSNALYFTNRFIVADRSRVNEAQMFFNLKSADILSQDDIQKLGLKLKADYLVIGKIINNTSDPYADVPDGKMNLNIRIVSIVNSGIAGMVDYSENYSGDINNAIDRAISKISKKLTVIK
jgi:hypothetical protein